jgi:hypothetical protein
MFIYIANIISTSNIFLSELTDSMRVFKVKGSGHVHACTLILKIHGFCVYICCKVYLAIDDGFKPIIFAMIQFS